MSEQGVLLEQGGGVATTPESPSSPQAAPAVPPPAGATYLTREQILNAADIAAEDVDVPEWGGTVRVKSMTGLERDAFDASLLDADNKVDTANMRAKLVASTVVDGAGVQLFTADDVTALGAHSGAALSRVVLVAQRLNGLTGDDLEAMVKSLGKGQSAAPGSA